LHFPQSEMRGILQRYWTDRGRTGRRFPVPLPLPLPAALTPERQAKQRQFYADWLAALQLLPFENMTYEGRIDYLLLKNLIETELRRLDLPPRPQGLLGPPA